MKVQRYNRVTEANYRKKPASKSSSYSLEQAKFDLPVLVKLQRCFLKHSSTPQLSYKEDLLLEYPNPATDHERVQTYDEKFKVDYLLHNLFRKFQGPSATPTEVREKRALVKMLQGELGCSRTNRRLKKISFGDVHVNTFVMRVQNLIAQILGELDLERVVALSRFSQGATSTQSMREVKHYRKYEFKSLQFTLSAFHNFFQYIRKDSSNATGASVSDVIIDNCNRVLTVPKTSEINRTIAAEPSGNMFFQLGVGALIRRKLRRFGIDLNDQTRNQRLALEGSISGHLATIDLENASNSLSLEAVRLLLPREWFEILRSLRSDEGVLPNGNKHTYRMFSSMGNGFTFELESLIFFAICKVASRNDFVSVYGDDIIIKSEHYAEVVHWLMFFGFKTNEQKSFHQGFFRESCGKHYYFGEDVSPFFVRAVPTSLACFTLYNNIVRWAMRESFYDIRAEEARVLILRSVPLDSQIFGPDGYGDGFMLDHTPSMSLTKYTLCRKTFRRRVRALTLRKKKRELNTIGAFTASMLGATKDAQVSSYEVLSTSLCMTQVTV